MKLSYGDAGALIWAYSKYSDIKGYYELYQATKSEDAALNIATKVSELVAGLAVGFVADKGFELFKKVVLIGFLIQYGKISR